MGIKDQFFDAMGVETVHCSLIPRELGVYKGSLFETKVLMKAGKKGAVVEWIHSELILKTDISSPGRDTAVFLAALGVGLTAAVLGGDGDVGITGGALEKTIKIPIHRSKFDDRLILGSEEEKILTITSIIPNKTPLDPTAKVTMDLDISIKGAPNIQLKDEIPYLPNKLTQAALDLLESEYGFTPDILNTRQNSHDLSEMYIFVPRIVPYEHVGDVELMVLELESGDLKFDIVLELYEKPKRIMKGAHATVHYSFQANKQLYQDPDEDLVISYVKSKLRRAFKEAEDRFQTEFPASDFME